MRNTNSERDSNPYRQEGLAVDEDGPTSPEALAEEHNYFLQLQADAHKLGQVISNDGTRIPVQSKGVKK